MPDGMDHPRHTNCRCTIGFAVDRPPLEAGDFVRYNGGGIGQITESRMSANGEHTLRIEGITGLDVASCDRLELLPDPRLDDPIPGSLRAEVENLQARIRRAEAAEGIGAPQSRATLEPEAARLVERLREVVRPGERFILDGVEHVAGSIIADDPTDDGALPGETTEERVVRQREASARWVRGIRDNDPGAVYDVVHEGPPLEFTREGVEEWGRRQGDEIRVDVGTPNTDHIDVTAHVDGFESVSRVSMFALHRARDPFFMLRTASEAALEAVRGMARAMGQAAEAAEQFRRVTQEIHFEPRFLDAEGAAERLRDMASEVGVSMRSFQAQYTNRPGAVDGNTGYEIEPRPERSPAFPEYTDEDHDFEDERDW